jgi:site-specific DNA-methyltransferase (cytosine-N4-specific)
MELHWHSYRYYPYERDLAVREARALLKGTSITRVNGRVILSGPCEAARLRRLVYFSAAVSKKERVLTIQGQLERAGGNGHNRQATRYSVHGLHEYKGKFNPQVARALLNILGFDKADRVLDPFCGSGTTLVECAHLGIPSFGVDLNPFAVYVANAKLLALGTPADKVRTALGRVIRDCRKKPGKLHDGDENQTYLRGWFHKEILETIEQLRTTVLQEYVEEPPILLTIASNLLRDYSLQDPNDLRIRRRCSALPTEPFIAAFEKAALSAIERLQQTQKILGDLSSPMRAQLFDVDALAASSEVGIFDGAITSPPYATALPYIDTQRLSLVWLRLIPPDEILELEAELIGSREIRGQKRQQLQEALDANAAELPTREIRFCRKLQRALREADGFRRQAVPVLLYRYFAGMAQAFAAVRSVIRKGGPFALIVGHNHTILGGERFDIDTPSHLVSLAAAEGWTLEERLPLQTYHRYGYHMGNAVRAETLLILRNG